MSSIVPIIAGVILGGVALPSIAAVIIHETGLDKKIHQKASEIMKGRKETAQKRKAEKSRDITLRHGLRGQDGTLGDHTGHFGNRFIPDKAL